MVDGRRLKPSKDAMVGMREDLAGVGEAVAAAAENADLLLCGGPVGTLLGWHVAEAVGCRSAAVVLQPSYRTSDFGPPALGVRSFGCVGNRAAWRTTAIGERLFAPLIDDLRQSLGLGRESRTGPRRKRQRRWTQLCGFSEHVVPRPRDWPDNVHVTGYWWPSENPSENAYPGLVDFLADGPPPVYIGLGSTAISDGGRISEVICDALRRNELRGVVHKGWAHLDGGSDSAMHTIDDVPHSWLLPRTVAAVHHCGAGTAAATLRAGVPTVALPGIMDQPFWANRLRRIGVAPDPIPRTRATVENLSAALRAVADGENGRSEYGHRAAALSSAIADESGVGRACQVVEDLLNTSTSA
ncbi:glycosyltransferase [Gordonia sp. C13]|uniref:glycosyltransferase n=1 Tax=Gordonia sp. C13 TaxID=2935078 RepID=UPI00200B3525|nr:glycosyltransferase [Gordonia sp. C13]MCK8616301.1 glycosyltransferase [Gordonia sp. C13]